MTPYIPLVARLYNCIAQLETINAELLAACEAGIASIIRHHNVSILPVWGEECKICASDYAVARIEAAIIKAKAT